MSEAERRGVWTDEPGGDEVGAAVAALDRVKLLAARFRAARARPYFASALYALSVVPTAQVPTMGVDRHWRLYVAPDFVDRTPVEQLAGVWLHEVAHLLRDHHGRAERLPLADRADHVRVNIAQDCEINDDLLAAGIELPAGRIAPDILGVPAGRLFEEYLPHVPRSRVHIVQCGSGAHDTGMPWEVGAADGPPAVSAVEAAAIRRHTAQALRRHLRGRGLTPGDWRRWADEVLEPTVDWRRMLAGAVRQAVAWASGAVDYTYQRPSRRTAALRGVVLPSLRRPVPRVAVVVDTSGSMGEDDLAAALAEIGGVLRGVGGQVTVLACDADVQAVRSVRRVEHVALAGGGGTDMRVGIAAALAVPDPPQVVVVLTDGHTPWPEVPTACRVVACLIGRRPTAPPPWIETIHIRD